MSSSSIFAVLAGVMGGFLGFLVLEDSSFERLGTLIGSGMGAILGSVVGGTQDIVSAVRKSEPDK